MEDRLIAERAADAFRARLGIGGWDWTTDWGQGDFYPTPGHRYLFNAAHGSSELRGYGITKLMLAVTVPADVFADVILDGGFVALIVRPNRVSLEIDMEPFGGLVYKTLSESEIDEMRREWEPFRLVMEAVEDADARLKSEVEAEKEDQDEEDAK
jgi:hypothetical protein